MALIDVDNFKQINDQHGHLVGDSVLRLLSEQLAASLRQDDMAGRYGGDEFCVILPNTPPVLAGEVVERMRRELADVRSPLAPGLRLSLSIGLAGYSLLPPGCQPLAQGRRPGAVPGEAERPRSGGDRPRYAARTARCRRLVCSALRAWQASASFLCTGTPMSSAIEGFEPLTATEVRILGCLIEKEATTPGNGPTDRQRRAAGCQPEDQHASR